MDRVVMNLTPFFVNLINKGRGDLGGMEFVVERKIIGTVNHFQWDNPSFFMMVFHFKVSLVLRHQFFNEDVDILVTSDKSAVLVSFRIDICKRKLAAILV